MELPAKTNAFQIKPDLENIIPPMEVKKIIGKILNETLLSRQHKLSPLNGTNNSHNFQDKSYTTENAKIWTKSIADDINRSLNQITQKYKHVVQVLKYINSLGHGKLFNSFLGSDYTEDRSRI